MNRTRLKKRYTLKEIFWWAALFSLLLSFTLNPVMSKFVGKWFGDIHNIQSQEFIFSSTCLKDATIRSAEPVIMFDLINYDDNGNCTEGDIYYTIKVFTPKYNADGSKVVGDNNMDEVTNNLFYTITDTTDTTDETDAINDSNTGTLDGGKASSHVVHIRGIGNSEVLPTEYKVMITSSYESYSEKILTATYEVYHLPDYEIEAVDAKSSAPYIFVTIHANDYDDYGGERKIPYNFRCVKKNIVPDNTDPKLSKYNNFSDGSKSCIGSLEPNTSTVYRFICIGDLPDDVENAFEIGPVLR